MGRVKIEVDHIECINTGNILSGDDVYFASTFRCGGPDAPTMKLEKPLPYDRLSKVSKDWRIVKGYKGPRWDMTDRVAFDGDCDDEGFVIGSIYFFDREGNDDERRQLKRLADLHTSLLDRMMLSVGGIYWSVGGFIGIGIGLALGFGAAGVIAAAFIGGAVGLLAMAVVIKITEFRRRGFKAFDFSDDFLGGVALRIPVKPIRTSRIRFEIKGPTDALKVSGAPGKAGKPLEFSGESGQHYKVRLKISRS